MEQELILRKFNDSFEIYGVDLNEHALEVARKNVPKANFIKKISQNYLLKMLLLILFLHISY